MSVSEKLRALDADWRERNHGEYGWLEPCVLGGDEIQRDYETIGTLLPLIADVVEAAERSAEVAHDFSPRLGPITRQELIPALSALDEKLGAA